jgi:hypothetical protein
MPRKFGGESRLTRVGEVRLVAGDRVGDGLLPLGELLHISRKGRLGSGRIHDVRVFWPLIVWSFMVLIVGLEVVKKMVCFFRWNR